MKTSTLRKSVALIMLAVGTVSAPALAETRPVDAGGGAPQYVAAPDTLDFPQALIGQIPDAVARQATARMMLTRAQANLSGTFRKMRFVYDRSNEYQAVAAEETTAFAAYRSARDVALAKLADDVNYLAVTRLRDELGERIAELQKVKDVRPESIAPLAAEKLNYARTASAIEAKAMAADATVAQARDQFVSAGTKLVRAKNAFDDSLRYHPDVEAARANLDDARVAAVTTAAYATSLVRVSNVALDYSYFLHRYDRATVGYPSDYYGYGSGGYGYGSTGAYRGYGYSR